MRIYTANQTAPVNIWTVLSKPAFSVLWLSETISLIGDRILMIALINMVYEWSGSAAAVSTLSLIKAVPALALGTVAGVFVDRWSRKWVMVFANLAQFALVLVIPWTSSLGVVFGVYFILSVVSQFFIPARSATIPQLVPHSALMVANSLFAVAFVGAIAIGPAVGGWIIDRYGMDTAYWVDALTFLVPAIAVSFLSIPRQTVSLERHSLGSDWREGIAVVRERADVRFSLVLIGAVALLIASLSALGVILVRENLGGSAGDFGLVMSLTGAGMVSGAILTPILAKSMERLLLAGCGALLGGAAMLGLALSNQMAGVLVAGFGLGFGVVSVQVNGQTILQQTPDRLRGRVLGLSQTVMGSVTFAAAGLAGGLAGWLGVREVLIGVGAASLIISLGVLFRILSEKSLYTGVNHENH
ncbi:MAG: MFS transporter [Anaerolineaceae bacterium]|nr:MFS transporter [Anaerolineaceae bacterium]